LDLKKFPKKVQLSIENNIKSLPRIDYTGSKSYVDSFNRQIHLVLKTASEKRWKDNVFLKATKGVMKKLHPELTDEQLDEYARQALEDYNNPRRQK
jgi:hypothetical protein